MKPPRKNERNLTELRVTRKSNVHVHAGDSHGWAVSYADLLMVLLSFFILYFNFSDATGEAPKSALNEISLAFRGEKATESSSVKVPDGKFTDISDVLKIEGLRITERNDHLIVDLEKSSFPPGGHHLRADLRTQVDQVIKALSPFKNTISITVIGHTDRKKLRPRGEFLQDNFDLSAVRALKVMKYVISVGFPENRASARAASSFDRDARSVSFEIRLAESPANGGA